MHLKFNLLLVLVLLTHFLNAQPFKNDSDKHSLNTFYNQHINESAILHSGPVYIPFVFPMDGTIFSKSDTLTKGWIVYDGHYYEDVWLQWDVLQNYVLTGPAVNKPRHILKNELIDSFYFAGQLVRNLESDKEHNLANGGFYSVLYNGDISVFVKRLKRIYTIVENRGVVQHFVDKNIGYVLKNGTYYRVNNKRDVLNLFNKNRGEIKREVKKNNLIWRHHFEDCLRVAVELVDKSNNKR